MHVFIDGVPYGEIMTVYDPSIFFLQGRMYITVEGESAHRAFFRT